MVLGVLAFCATGLRGQSPLPGSAADGQGTPEVRFALALQLSGSWCYGYLHVSQDKIRFEVIQPQSDAGRSFDAPRSEVVAGQWIIFGVPQDAIELRTKAATYHMRWLANESEVSSGAPRRWSPPLSRPPYAVIQAIQNPAAALAQGGPPAGSPAKAKVSQPLPAGSNAGNAAENAASGQAAVSSHPPLDVPADRLAGVYVATAGADARPSNTQYLFYPDGYVMNGVPQSGLLNFDLSHYRREDIHENYYRVGRYKVEGDTIKILWIDQFTDPMKPDVITRNETSAHPAFEVGNQIFIPMCHCSGKRLSGLYRWGGPGQDQYIQFFPDGTFLDHRSTDELLVITFEHPRIQRGTYQIADQTIIFSFSDGHRGTTSFLAPKAQKDNPTFDWISFGWHMFFEEGYRARLAEHF